MAHIKCSDKQLNNVAYLYPSGDTWACKLRNGIPADISYAGLEHSRHGEFQLAAQGLNVHQVLALVLKHYARRYKPTGETMFTFEIEGEGEKPSLEDVFNSLDPESVNLSLFPPEDDRGESEGDALLAECIVYGYSPDPSWNNQNGLTEKQVEWAIKLGRALERNKL